MLVFLFFLVFGTNLDPPDDSDLKCETRDLESIDCFWNVGRAANEHPAMERTYQLQGRYNKTQPPLIYLQSQGVHLLDTLLKINADRFKFRRTKS